MYCKPQTTKKKNNVTFKDIAALKSVLKNSIFSRGEQEIFLFDDDRYVVLRNNAVILSGERNIIWRSAKPKRKYSIFQYEENYILRTFKNELHGQENEFLISVADRSYTEYAVILIPISHKTEQIILLSQQAQ